MQLFLLALYSYFLLQHHVLMETSGFEVAQTIMRAE